jgi:hypothetical protein
MAAPSSLRLLLAGACGLLLLGGIAGAAIVEDDTGTRAASDRAGDGGGGGVGEGEATTTTTVGLGGEGLVPGPVAGDPGAVTTATSAAPSTTGAGGATTTARGRPGGAAGPGALMPPKTGNYVYQATTTSSGGTRTDRTTTMVEPAGNEGATTVQAITIPLELGGQQALTRNTVAWSAAAGAVVRRSVISVTVGGLGPQQLDCVWQPPFAQYADGLAVGKAWSFETRCVGRIQGFDVVIDQRAARRVTGSGSIASPAGPVQTWTIADDTTVVVTSPLGVNTVRTVGTQQLAPSLGLPVRTDSKVDATMPGAPPQQSTVTTRLVAVP